MFGHISKRVGNTTHSRDFLTNFEVFGNVVKHSLECLICLLIVGLPFSTLTYFLYCVVPENIHIPLVEFFFGLTPPPNFFGKSSSSSYFPSKCSKRLLRPKIIILCGVDINIFWNHVHVLFLVIEDYEKSFFRVNGKDLYKPF